MELAEEITAATAATAATVATAATAATSGATTVTDATVPATITLSRDTFKRLVKDVKTLLHEPLTSNGIYYQHNDDNILTGHAMIIGPSGTPYADGFYFFKFTFPTNYPYSPPIVTFLTNDGKTRFNPNFYRTGKVCLSLLNTWKGERWTACQSISSILLVLCSTLNEYPLTNEPGIRISDKQVLPYNDILTYRNTEYAVVQQLKLLQRAEPPPDFMQPFTAVMQSHFAKTRENLIQRLIQLQQKYNGADVSLRIKLYDSNLQTRFADVLASLIE